MDAKDSCCVWGGAVVGARGVLDLGAIYYGCVFVWVILRFCGVRMVKLEAEVGNVVLHFEVASLLGVVPVKVNSIEQVSLPVISYFVVFFEGILEVKGVTLAVVLNAKVVNY